MGKTIFILEFYTQPNYHQMQVQNKHILQNKVKKKSFH